DARDRFLNPGGCVIPRRETLWAALVEAAPLHQKIADVWGKDVFGIDMTAVRPTAVNTWQKTRLCPPDLVTSPQCWAVLDYAVLESPHVRGGASWKIHEHRTAHGIGAWFDWEGPDGARSRSGHRGDRRARASRSSRGLAAAPARRRCGGVDRGGFATSRPLAVRLDASSRWHARGVAGGVHHRVSASRA